MTIGPVEYVIIEFPDSKFNGAIVPALSDLIESGTIRLLDLIFITKDDDGNAVGVEFDEDDLLSGFGDLEGEVGGLFTPEDLEHAASTLEPGSSAALLMWEDTWATPLVQALLASGAILREGARIPRELIEAAMGELDTAR
jgi:hypothetical protein